MKLNGSQDFSLLFFGLKMSIFDMVNVPVWDLTACQVWESLFENVWDEIEGRNCIYIWYMYVYITRTQKWYEHKDKGKERESKVDALEEVFPFIHLKYHKLWRDEPDYDASYVQPTRADLEAALLELESAKASWIYTPKWSQLRPVEMLLQMESDSSGQLKCYSKTWRQLKSVDTTSVRATENDDFIIWALVHFICVILGIGHWYHF